MADHFGLNLHLVELLSGVDANHAANHLRHHNHVSEMGLDKIWLLVGLGLLLGLAELLNQTHGLALETAVEPSAGTGVDEVAELLRAEVEELVEVDSTVGELAERALGLDGCGVLSARILSHRCFSSVCTLRLRPPNATSILYRPVLKRQ